MRAGELSPDPSLVPVNVVHRFFEIVTWCGSCTVLQVVVAMISLCTDAVKKEKIGLLYNIALLF